MLQCRQRIGESECHRKLWGRVDLVKGWRRWWQRQRQNEEGKTIDGGGSGKERGG